MFANITKGLWVGLGAVTAAAAISATPVMADSIDPVSYTDTLAVGESVTIRKTVTVDDAPPTSGILDVMFLIDTSGSMGDEIDAAKAAASDILTGLAGFGDLSSGVGYYSEPGSLGVKHDLTTNTATAVANINTIFLGEGGFGGDFPEEGIHAVTEAATGASWRPGSSRFIIALGDATFKASDGSTLGDAQTALADSGATFIGIDYGNMTRDDFGGIDPTVLATATGGSIVTASGLDTDDLVTDILAGVTDAFSEYSKVTVDDLGTSGAGVDVSVSCVSADIGVCAGDTATGTYDRSVTRSFEFDVTFTGAVPGAHGFTMSGLVDGGTVAIERDLIKVTSATSVPEPGTLALLGMGLAGLGISRRRKSR